MKPRAIHCARSCFCCLDSSRVSLQFRSLPNLGRPCLRRRLGAGCDPGEILELSAPDDGRRALLSLGVVRSSRSRPWSHCRRHPTGPGHDRPPSTLGIWRSGLAVGARVPRPACFRPRQRLFPPVLNQPLRCQGFRGMAFSYSSSAKMRLSRSKSAGSAVRFWLSRRLLPSHSRQRQRQWARKSGARSQTRCSSTRHWSASP